MSATMRMPTSESLSGLGSPLLSVLTPITPHRRPSTPTAQGGGFRLHRLRRPVLPKDAYTPWANRLLAFLIDWTLLAAYFF